MVIMTICLDSWFLMHMSCMSHLEFDQQVSIGVNLIISAFKAS